MGVGVTVWGTESMHPNRIDDKIFMIKGQYFILTLTPRADAGGGGGVRGSAPPPPPLEPVY